MRRSTACRQTPIKLRDQLPCRRASVILTSGGEPRIAHLLDLAASAAGGVTLLDRPLRAATLLRAVDVALRSRRRQYEIRDLLDAKARLAAIVESSDDAIYSYDSDGVVLSWNRGAERLFGWPAEALVGGGIARITPPECADDAADVTRRVLEGQTVAHLETVCCRRDGTRFDVVLTASAVRGVGGRPQAVSVITRDITARKRTERALQRAKPRSAMFSISSAWQGAARPRHRTVPQVIDAMCRFVGYTRQELLARSVLDITHAADQARDRHAMRRLLSGDAEDDDVEKRFVRADGTVVWAQVTMNVIRDEEGRPARYTAIVQDMSRRRAAEVRCRPAN
jgi:PAS domain S-box-containing protein